MSLINAIELITTTFGTDKSDAVALVASKDSGQWISTVRNLNHATAIWLDLGKGQYRNDELQSFLECFGARSKAAASNRVCMQRSHQRGANKYNVKAEDVTSFPIAAVRTARSATTLVSADDAEALDALLG